MATTKPYWREEQGWILVESPMAKFASHELANEAASTPPDPSSEPVSGSSVVSVPTGDELLADFKLCKRINSAQITIIASLQIICFQFISNQEPVKAYTLYKDIPIGSRKYTLEKLDKM